MIDWLNDNDKLAHSCESSSFALWSFKGQMSWLFSPETRYLIFQRWVQTTGAKSSDPNKGINTHDLPPRGHNKPVWTHVDSLLLNQKCFVFLFLKSGDSSLTLVAKCSVLSTSWRQQYILLYVNKFIWVQWATFMNEKVMNVQTWFLQINQNFAANKY